MSRTSTFWLACTEYRLVPYSPCMWFKNTRFNIRNATKFTTLSTFHGHYSFPRRDIPGKPFCTALSSFVPVYLGYDRYVHNHICVLAFFTDTGRITNRGSFAVEIYNHLWFKRPVYRTAELLVLAGCRLLKFSFRAWRNYCILSLLSLDRFFEGVLINISSKKNAFVRVFTLTIRHFETGLFKKYEKIR